MHFDVLNELIREQKQLNNLIRLVSNRLPEQPVGSLVINNKEGFLQYYHNFINPDTHRLVRKYLKKDDPLIKLLAQKSYDSSLLKAALIQKDVIEKFLQSYDMDSLKQIYTKTTSERKKFIKADIVDDEEYVRRWCAVEYPAGEFGKNDPEYYTFKGERVRSKSEKIIADALYKSEIPYRYEFPIKLNDGREWRRDFLILNRRTRREFTHEHFGMMDNPEYFCNALGKISIYMQNGLFLGDNLVITAESKNYPLSTKDLNLIIKHYYS